MPDLYRRSIEIILANQHPSGAYVACPNFPTYRYTWFRDASFVAYAMDCVGEHASAGRFHAWAARAICERAGVIERGLEKADRGEKLADADVLHTRLTLEGRDGRRQKWGNFQLDGFGTWLWALEQHRRLCGETLPAEWLEAAGLAARYLAALWERPCYDCWEEHPERVHPYTLAAIYGGLKAYAGLAVPPPGLPQNHAFLILGEGQLAPQAPKDQESMILGEGQGVGETLAAIKEYIYAHFVWQGHFVKFAGEAGVDASLLGLAAPYGVVEPDDPLMRATVSEIERTLLDGGAGAHGAPYGGVHRYAADVYYGGGEWILLAAWLGWYYRMAGREAEVGPLLAWIEAQAAPDGSLPEQVSGKLLAPAQHAPWVAKWGPVATPLLWSHASYMILKKSPHA